MSVPDPVVRFGQSWFVFNSQQKKTHNDTSEKNRVEEQQVETDHDDDDETKENKESAVDNEDSHDVDETHETTITTNTIPTVQENHQVIIMEHIDQRFDELKKTIETLMSNQFERLENTLDAFMQSLSHNNNNNNQLPSTPEHGRLVGGGGGGGVQKRTRKLMKSVSPAAIASTRLQQQTPPSSVASNEKFELEELYEDSEIQEM